MSGLAKKSDVSRLAEMVNGFQHSCVLVAALQVGLIEALEQGPRSLQRLAHDLTLHAPSLQRLLRALEALSLLQRDGTDWALTSSGQLLRKGGPAAGLRAWAELVGGEYLGAWGGLSHSVRTGQAAFPKVFGQTAWEHRGEHPALDDAFQRFTRGEQSLSVSGLNRAYTFGDCRTVVDVGGGHGLLLAGVLAAHPEMKGVLFDLPHVVAGAGPVLTKAGVRERCRLRSGSFFDEVPEGGDVYLLKHVLHNWDDDGCLVILKRCAAAMAKGARMLVLENILPDEEREADLSLLMVDLHMLAVLGGRERSEAEYAALLAEAGLRLNQRLTTRLGAPDILEVVTA